MRAIYNAETHIKQHNITKSTQNYQQIKLSNSKPHLLMSRSPAPLRLSRKPDLLQHIPETHQKKEKKLATIIHPKPTALHRFNSLLPLRLMMHQNGSPKSSPPDLLHQLILIHPGLHLSLPTPQINNTNVSSLNQTDTLAFTPSSRHSRLT